MGHEVNEIIRSIDIIFEKGHKSKLTDNFIKSVSKETEVVSKYLGLDSETQSVQTVLFCLVMSLTVQKNSSIDLDDFSSYLNTSILRTFLFQNQFEDLIRKKLLRKIRPSRRRRNNENLDFLNLFVPNDIVFSIVNGDPLPVRKSSLNIYEIFDCVHSLIEQKEECFIGIEELISEIEGMMSENKNLPFVRQILNFKLPSFELIILLFLCQQFTEGNQSVDLVRLTRTLLNDTQKQLNIRKKFINEDTKLQKCQLVSLETETNFKSDRIIVLSSKGKDLFGEDKNLFIEQETTKHSDIILSTSISEKQLFFNSKEQTQLEQLTDILRPTNYDQLMSRLRGLNMKPSVTVLFHGFPGTGKTESVYQLSRLTGRNIRRVEISETKSKWFGQSERLIKGVFDTYRKLVESSELTPILLFNEVDGIFGSRKTNGTSSVDQTENSIQTIILQEIEEFKGILICTTNLPMNLDKSFDRRFLFKTFFDKPDSVTRSHIWKDKLPVLTEKQTQYLSERFDFSGGQIDNICKKVVMTQILTGNIPDLREIEQFCQTETLETKTQRNPIGFRIGSISN